MRKQKEVKILNIKISKMATICLLIALVVCVGYASKEGMARTGAEVALTLSAMPKLNEVFEVKAKIIGKKGLDEYAYYFPTYEFMATLDISSKERESVKILGKNEIYIPELRNGWTKELKFRLQIIKKIPYISIVCHLYPIRDFRMGRVTQVADVIELYLLDFQTGQYGTREEYEKQLKEQAEWWYDPAGEFTNDPVSPDCAARNKEIIVQLKKLEPNLTDWEALYLHYDGIQALMGGMGTYQTTDEDRWRFLLEMGWLEKQRVGKKIKEKWLKELIEKYKGKPLTKEQGLNPNFFRGDADNTVDNSSSSDSTKTRWSYIYFKGQFRYKKHKYNKDQGLLTQTEDIPICSVLVRVRSYWSGSGGSRWSFRTNTDNDGKFLATLSWEVPANIWIKAHPLIYFWGPTPTNRVINVSDPTPTSYITWRDPIDTTIFLLPRVQGGVDSFFTSTDTFDFGTMYIDSFISGTNPQPKSGAANISQTYLHARTFTTPPPTWPLRVLWEPGYTEGTSFKPDADTITPIEDTIRVYAVNTEDSDEWDDDILLHECGHFTMHYYAEIPPNAGGYHRWQDFVYDRPNLAYSEAWAHFFSGRARAGSSIDSLLVDTRKGIGGDSCWWWNLEDP